jgi:MFS family permease
VHAEAKHAAALTAYVLVVVGVTATIIQGGLIGRLAKRFGERRLLIAGTAVTGLGLFSIPLTGEVRVYGLLLVVAAILAIGTGFTNPSLSSLLSQSVDRTEQGGALGIGQSLAALGRVIGPSGAGMLFQLSRGMPFWLGAGMMVLCSGIAVALRPRPALS